jgi:hypothetical protein
MTLPHSGAFLAVYLILFLMAVLYDRWVVGEMERRGIDGYTWLQVVGGVGFTIAGVSFISGEAALITLGAFAASGAPMIAGALIRRERRIRRALRNGHEQPTATRK